MFQRIIVPLDGSRRAERAIPAASRLARAAQGSIVFLRVIVPSNEIGFYGTNPMVDALPTLLETKCAEADEYLSSIITAFRDELDGIKTETEVETGTAASTIISAARWEHGDLIVLCSHGDTGLKRWVFNSIALQTALHSPVPVLVLNEHDEAHSLERLTMSLRVLVPLDGSELAETALAPVTQLLAALRPIGTTMLHLLRVVDVPLLNGSMRDQAHVDALVRQHASMEAQMYLDTVVKRLQEANQGNTPLSLTTSVIISPDIPGTIIQQAAAQHCDAISIATHGRGGLMRLLTGSVTEGLLGHTTLPVLVTRPTQPVVEKNVVHDPMVAEKELPSWVGLL
jgi:nucleotide-binding universal stress UspA family protein